MKKLGKIVVALASAVLVFGFISCAEEEGTTGRIGKDFVITNNGHGEYLRGYYSLKTKHTSGSAYITFGKTSDAPTDQGAGVIGFIFGLKDHKDGSGKKTGGVDFGIVGIRRKKDNSYTYYISYVKNATMTSEGKDGYSSSSYFQDTEGEDIKGTASATTGAIEYEIVGISPLPSVNASTFSEEEDAYFVVEVLATPADGETAPIKAGQGNGGYTINIYKGKLNGKNVEKDGVAIVSGKKIEPEKTGDSVATQYDLGLYTSVNKNATLRGKLSLPSSDLVNEGMVYYGDEFDYVD